MNRTLTESRHVIQLMDKMKGQFPTDKPRGIRVEDDYESKPLNTEAERYRELPKISEHGANRGRK